MPNPEDQDSLATRAEVDSTPESPQDDPLWRFPERIGRYRVVKLLGEGGFGRVFLAQDEDLDRPVAIKVPRPDRISRPEDVEAYLTEARTLARLDHPAIVPVLDVGRTDDGLCFVVSKYIEGTDLAGRIKQGAFSLHAAASLIATVADALHYAHSRHLVHRDVKPANILIDASGKASLADFGLALKEEDFGKGSGMAGTPAYMSPEQARGEGHRVDGRSDVYSLGVVFYELLTGRRPFQGDSIQDILEKITESDARPPRQFVDSIPREVERICLKALSKRATDRYPTAGDLAEDLQVFLKLSGSPDSPPVANVLPSLITPPGSTIEATPVPRESVPSDSDLRPIKIVPKGLRSFDEHDADFFLELLPGARDRDGLPEVLRFWKTRIEILDPDKTFKVGLIYGPSGCGKSSLVKAGLIPRLSKHVHTVYIEATPEETESRLLRGLRKVCHELPPSLGLVDAISSLRRGRLMGKGRKVLLVLDQFEQWLFAKRSDQDTELVAALRQCDGEHVQAIVMVRDDFWMAATRLMRDLEIRLVESENSAAVDLFDPRHASKVLTAFGRAYGALPENPSDFTPEHKAFTDQSITGLAQDGKVISVRLALFAEMVKGKPWTPATLKSVGGTQGVGVTFLEETFSATTAPPEHRLHQKAAQAVLKALLPETGTDIKGEMKSEAELREASGYANRPRDFDDLIRILDAELRLITPTDPEGSADEGQADKPTGGRYYQFTHDYLVPSLREWLTRKQRETRRGRAELKLAERSATWNAKPENRLLPSVLEWASIRSLTREKDWTEPQRRMMRRAGRWHALRGAMAAALLLAVVVTGVEVRRRVNEERRATIAAGLVDQVLNASTTQVPGIVESMAAYRRWTDPALRTAFAKAPEASPARLHASLALLPVDSGQVDYLYERLLKASPSDLQVIVERLRDDHRASLIPKLWSLVETAKSDDPRLLPASSALAAFDHSGTAWGKLGDKVAHALVGVNPILLGPWLDALRPARTKITAPLAAIFRDDRRPPEERSLATTILADYAQDDADLLASLVLVSEPKDFTTFYPPVERHSTKTIPLFQAELRKSCKPEWLDSPPDPAWESPDQACKRLVEAGRGMLADRFGFCQTLPLEEFRTLSEGLRKSGYRPTRFRPYADGPVVRVAAVWTRDGRNWRITSGLTAEDLRREDGKLQAEIFQPVDVAGYVASDMGGQAADRYAAIWVERVGDDQASLLVGLTPTERTSLTQALAKEKWVPRSQQVIRGSDGVTRSCAVWGRSSATSVTGQSSLDTLEGLVGTAQAGLPIDLSVYGTGRMPSSRDRAQSALATAENNLKATPDDLSARFARATAFFSLGDWARSLADLDVVVKKVPRFVSVEKAPMFDSALQYRALVLARLGRKDKALTDLASFQKTGATPTVKLYLAVIVAAELGVGEDQANEALEVALKQKPEDSGLLYDAACAYSLASRAVSTRDQPRSQVHAERATSLLALAIRQGYADYGHILEDEDLDPIRDRPGFAKAIEGGHVDRRYATVTTSTVEFEAIKVLGLDPAAQLDRCRALESQGYRPVSFSIARTTPEGEPVTASIWHRPLITEQAKDQLAERQARAAICLVRLGQADEVWPLLRHSADPRLRSFLVNWLNPLGADPERIATRLERIDPRIKPSPVDGQQAMDAVLFHPETSIRRALILALGTYGTEGLSPAEREPLTVKLLDLYRNDPDAGIHGASEWTLRQWKQQEKLKAADADLMALKDRGDRRWIVNSQGQTFAVIDGPVEFPMGSPPTDPERFSDETSHRVRIPRRFAIASKEVSVEQYQRFVQTNPAFGFDQSYLDKYSHDPSGPMIRVSWYGAAAYCNWLSEQDGLLRDQWCYLPAENGDFAQGMMIPADVLRRTGYRLPTEAEWEYACRSGTLTSRYHGISTDLLRKTYAWYQANSQEHTWRCGSLQPNDLGLFDMLGNVYEWCQDKNRLDQDGEIKEHDTKTSEFVTEDPRLVRGGAFDGLPSYVRSAFRYRIAPSSSINSYGFRPSRTCQ